MLYKHETSSNLRASPITKNELLRSCVKFVVLPIYCHVVRANISSLHRSIASVDGFFCLVYAINIRKESLMAKVNNKVVINFLVSVFYRLTTNMYMICELICLLIICHVRTEFLVYCSLHLVKASDK